MQQGFCKEKQTKIRVDAGLVSSCVDVEMLELRHRRSSYNSKMENSTSSQEESDTHRPGTCAGTDQRGRRTTGREQYL